MIEFTEKKIQRILNPTSINLGEYVINPYMGCAFRCLYCYVRSNRVVARRNKEWGTYVDIRVNAPELLEKELAKKKPQAVLIGSTTDCFQPVEKKYGLTEKILMILNRHGVYYTILTRSPLLLDYIKLLAEGFCTAIYFTVNWYPESMKNALEPAAPAFEERINAVEKLFEAGIPVIPYVSPVLPWITDIGKIFTLLDKAPAIDFECLNFHHAHTPAVIRAIARVDGCLGSKYDRMMKDRVCYDRVWDELQKKVSQEAKKSGKEYHIFVHKWGGYFNNVY